MSSFFYEAVEDNPIIAAVKNMNDLEICCSLEDIRVVFILFGDVCSIKEIVDKVKAAGKVAMVHVDLISGLSSKDIVVEFIQKNTKADGIISTKPTLIKKGRELGNSAPASIAYLYAIPFVIGIVLCIIGAFYFKNKSR
mgnify:CR=1 FL=1